MTGFFTRLAPGSYRTGDRPLRTETDGIGWTRDYARALDRGEPFHLLIDARHGPTETAARPMTIWMKAHKALLGRLVELAVYIVETPEDQASFRDCAVKTQAGYPYPVRIASDFAEAFALCLPEQLSRRMLSTQLG